MTWCSELRAIPGFVLASSAIRCRFVDRFVGLRVPSHVSRQRFSLLAPPFPRNHPVKAALLVARNRLMFARRVIARTQASGKRHDLSAYRGFVGDGAAAKLHAGGEGPSCGRGVPAGGGGDCVIRCIATTVSV